MSTQAIHLPTGLTTDGAIGRRYIALIIDSFVVVILIGVVIALLRPVLFSLNAGNLVVIFLRSVVILFLVVLYGAVLESSAWQATVGKKVFGLKAFDASGQRMNFGRAAGRNLAKNLPGTILSAFPFGQFLPILWAVAQIVVVHNSPLNQAIHDRVAGTLVARPEDTTQLRLS